VPMAQPGLLSSRPQPTAAPMTLARMLGWLMLVSSVIWPRIVILSFWIFGSTLGRAFDSWVVPAIGFLVLPWTTMTYALMWGISSDRVTGVVEWAAVAVAVLFDLWTYLGARHLFTT
jgi:hypothetical protein